MPTYTTLEKRDGIMTITLNRPEVLNALTVEMVREVGSHLAEARFDAAVRVIVLTGAGRGFCSGADVNRLSVEGGAPPSQLQHEIHAIERAIINLNKPVVAGLNGVAVGAGFGLAMTCDLRVAQEDVTLKDGALRLGLISGHYLPYALTHMLGLAKAMDILLLDRTLSAQEALQLGLVSSVVAPDRFPEALRDVARKLAGSAPLALRLTKQAIQLAEASDLESNLRFLVQAVETTSASKDHEEGLRAFFEKRNPEFTGE